MPAVQALISGGNPVAIRLGDTTYVQSGVKDSIYNSVPTGKVVAVPVVQQVNPGNFQTVVAIAAFQITGVDKVGGKSFIQGQFVHGLKVAGLSAGNGGGQDLGAQTGLGLSIVRTLVTTELAGSIEMRQASESELQSADLSPRPGNSGTVIELRVPLVGD